MGNPLFIIFVVLQTFASFGLLAMWDEVKSFQFQGQPVGDFLLISASVWVFAFLVVLLIAFGPFHNKQQSQSAENK